MEERKISSERAELIRSILEKLDNEKYSIKDLTNTTHSTGMHSGDTSSNIFSCNIKLEDKDHAYNRPEEIIKKIQDYL